MIKVINEKCKGCELCVKSCAFGAIAMINNIAVIDIDKCTLCGACVSACPFDAIVIKKKEQTKINRSEYNGVWIFAEQKNNEIAAVVFELLGKGRELADKKNTELSAILLGHNVSNLVNELIVAGADKVIVVDKKILNSFFIQAFFFEQYNKDLFELSIRNRFALVYKVKSPN